ncbi:type I-C CRISPR-associated protein Cas5c [Azospirillum brasilense]|uniref:type I-C CRISPR-associated protein Cas5c n=1 Tax=Azospirillum brasilense TaxID=192 RepID=UPI001FFE605F|nr:type I-C CRISPR-associated protein Cas5c [Azospirillum brasilense]
MSEFFCTSLTDAQFQRDETRLSCCGTLTAGGSPCRTALHCGSQGARACFSRAEFKTERVSYDVITPSAALRIFDSVYWRPGLRWIIDRIHVCKPIRFQSLSHNEIGDRIPVASVRQAMRNGDVQTLPRIAADIRQRRAATVLVEVDYLVATHLTLTDDSPVGDRLDIPLGIFTRRARRGQCFRAPCLGTREFPADVMLWEGCRRCTNSPTTSATATSASCRWTSIMASSSWR